MMNLFVNVKLMATEELLTKQEAEKIILYDIQEDEVNNGFIRRIARNIHKICTEELATKDYIDELIAFRNWLEDPEFWKKALYEELNKLQANDYKEWDKELNTLSIEVLADWTQYLTAEDRIEFFDNIDDELRDRFNAYIG